MPIYPYQCENCGKELDKLQKISDPVLTTCPNCHHNSLKRMLSAPNFRLSGSGWYETDFKKDSDKQKNLTNYETDAKKEHSGDSKPDNKKSSGENKSDTKKETTVSANKKEKSSSSES